MVKRCCVVILFKKIIYIPYIKAYKVIMGKYIGCYFNLIENSVNYTQGVYDLLDSVKYNMNYTIAKIIYETYNFSIEEEYLFIKGNNVNERKTFSISKNKSILLIKTGLVIDVFILNRIPGYLFVQKDTIHWSKFFIVSLNDNVSCDNRLPTFKNPSDYSYLHKNAFDFYIEKDDSESSDSMSTDPEPIMKDIEPIMKYIEPVMKDTATKNKFLPIIKFIPVKKQEDVECNKDFVEELKLKMESGLIKKLE